MIHQLGDEGAATTSKVVQVEPHSCSQEPKETLPKEPKPILTVLKLQVGLLGTAKSLQMDLNVIAKTANTSTSEGFKYILKEMILSLLRDPDYCISSYSSVDMMSSAKEGEKRFNQHSIVERDLTGTVRIIVAARGEHELPPIKNGAELKKTLEKLASIPSTDIMPRCYGPHSRKMILFQNKNCLRIIHFCALFR
nr:hypothetical protein [Tanacetum cinerariifolium]